MTRQIGDFEGTPVSREYVAKELGFVDVEALHEWSKSEPIRHMGGSHMTDHLLHEICNLKSLVRTLQQRINELDNRTVGSIRL